MINAQRMAQRFKTLVEIDSLSRKERNVAQAIEKILTGLGAEVVYDAAGEKVGGNCSNMIARFRGTVDAEPLFLCGHMDTVGPGEGVRAVFADGVFRSDGTTILGADDKSAIVIILEVMEVLLENRMDHPPVEVIFTVCEEIGLQGAKNMDYSLMNARFGYILDSADMEGIVTRAPAATKITVKVYGKSAHAGSAPEKGVNAIAVASRAISRLALGRIDEETTCNIGTIRGGVATNIVPEQVEVQGEARSHDPEKLLSVSRKMAEAFQETAGEFKATGHAVRVETSIEEDFPNTRIPEDHRVIRLARKAAANLGIPLAARTTGGGADANVFFGKGLVAGVLGTGMTDIHTVNESIALKDMENTARLILEILKIHAAGAPL